MLEVIYDEVWKNPGFNIKTFSSLYISSASVEYGDFVVLKRKPHMPFLWVNEGREITLTTWNSTPCFPASLKVSPREFMQAVAACFLRRWAAACLTVTVCSSSLQRAQLLTCSLGLKEIWTEYLSQWLGQQGGTGEETILGWKAELLYIGLCRLHCLEITRIMEFRVVSCHETEPVLLWYSLDVSLWLYLKHVAITPF